MYVVLGYLPVDGMTAKAYKFNHGFLIETATKIVNEVKGVNRFTYYLTLNHLVLLFVLQIISIPDWTLSGKIN